ncbi:Homologous-pairing protein 2 homolog, partial [Linum grandiflorum]
SDSPIFSRRSWKVSLIRWRPIGNFFGRLSRPFPSDQQWLPKLIARNVSPSFSTISRSTPCYLSRFFTPLLRRDFRYYADFVASFVLTFFVAIVLNFVNEQNRPLNVQNAADALQKFNLKKAGVQKALDALADSGKISFKEYGKQKIYIARQDQFDIPNADELTQMKDENAKLQQQLGEQKKTISEVEGEIKGLQSNLTLEQILDREAKLKEEVREMEEKLQKMSGGVALVKPEERKAVSDMFSERLSQWRKRKRMFKDLWDAITENSPKDLKEFKEELGIEYDEDVGVSLQSLSDLVQPADKRRRFK